MSMTSTQTNTLLNGLLREIKIGHARAKPVPVSDGGESAALLSSALNVPMRIMGHSLGRHKLEYINKKKSTLQANYGGKKDYIKNILKRLFTKISGDCHACTLS